MYTAIRPGIQYISKHAGIITTNIMINLYSKTKSQIKLKGKLSNSIAEKFGVNQGGVLSPFLFIEFLKDLGSYLDNIGVYISDDEILNYLLWADDLVLLSSTPEGLQHLLDGLHNFTRQWHLIVNTLKTKVMIVTSARHTPAPIFTFNSQPVEHV